MKRFILGIGFGCLLLTAPALAQSPVVWRQTGVGPMPSAQQAMLSGQGGSGVFIDQAGTGNRLTTNSQGQNNALTLRQLGNQNQLELNLLGNGNQYNVDQLGSRNVLRMPDVRSDNVNVQLIQRGDGNQLIREGSLSVGVPMRIEQTGGMKVILTNHNF